MVPVCFSCSCLIVDDWTGRDLLHSSLKYPFASIMKLRLDSMLSSGYSGFPLFRCFYLTGNMLEFIYSTLLCYIFIDLF